MPVKFYRHWPERPEGSSCRFSLVDCAYSWGRGRGVVSAASLGWRDRPWRVLSFVFATRQHCDLRMRMYSTCLMFEVSDLLEVS